MDPSMIAKQLSDVLVVLDDLVDETKTAGQELARRETNFKVKFAKERLKVRAEADGRRITADEVEDHATVATEAERFDHLVASQTMTYTREALRAAETRVDALRTMSASIRGAGG